MAITYASGSGQRVQLSFLPNYPTDVCVEPYSNMVATGIAVDKIAA
jgi:hypothetical protein